uniref:Uncharacterized protein n=1 Tax=viral metagenome TaxID=1070528 RepID=A0A6C0J2V6_9ZZZZ
MKNFNLFIITDNMNNLFKGIDNMTLLSYVTLVLSIAIFVSILFGCTYKKRFERFETEKTDSETKKSEKKEFVLTDEEKALLDGLQNGSIDEKKLETFISEEKVTKESVEKLIEHIQEKFVNKVNDSKDKK